MDFGNIDLNLYTDVTGQNLGLWEWFIRKPRLKWSCTDFQQQRVWSSFLKYMLHRTSSPEKAPFVRFWFWAAPCAGASLGLAQYFRNSVRDICFYNSFLGNLIDSNIAQNRSPTFCTTVQENSVLLQDSLWLSFWLSTSGDFFSPGIRGS